MYVGAVHMYAQKLLPRAQQCLVTSLRRLRHDVIEHGVAHPSRARDDDRAKGGVRIWDMPQKCLIERIVEAREAFLVRCCGASALARDWDINAL